MIESQFQHRLIQKLKEKFSGCTVLKTDPTYIQGFPDLLILFQKKWAALECKKSASASHRPNQEYYVNSLNDVGFASFIYPENEDEVVNALSLYFKEG